MTTALARIKSSRAAIASLAAIAVAVALGVGAAFGTARGTPAPVVAYTLLDGTQHSSADWRGKVVLVNFWATTCASCVHEMPQIAALHEQFKARGFETIAVSMRYDAPASVVHFATTRRLPFGVAIDNTGAIAQGFGDVEATPTTFLVDKRGRIVDRFVGTPDFAALGERIESLLAAPA
ncbi:MAG TPA: TlpA disulfide reductase family protein [Burkholderiaceae bacterium]|nr:TlpA disulfide reductase family protein [Burkholderiaceae bacterium]